MFTFTFPAFEEDLVVALQSFGHVVGVEDGHLCSVNQSLGTHHLQEQTRYAMTIKKHILTKLILISTMLF